MSLAETRVRLLRTPSGQTLDLPRGFELAGDEAILRMDGRRLIVELARPKSILAALEGLEDIDETWPDIEDRAPEAVRI